MPTLRWEAKEGPKYRGKEEEGEKAQHLRPLRRCGQQERQALPGMPSYRSVRLPELRCIEGCV